MGMYSDIAILMTNKTFYSCVDWMRDNNIKPEDNFLYDANTIEVLESTNVLVMIHGIKWYPEYDIVKTFFKFFDEIDDTDWGFLELHETGTTDSGGDLLYGDDYIGYEPNFILPDRSHSREITNVKRLMSDEILRVFINI
jgi:hypothetical protein